MKFVSLLVASNLASLVVTTGIVLLAWQSLSLRNEQQLEQYRRETQTCCDCLAPTPAPTMLLVSPTPVTSTQAPNDLNSRSSFACPNEEGSIDFTNEGTVDISISDRMCTLVLVASDNKSFKPMGRSYEGFPWEASAGTFDTLTFECDGKLCLVDLPQLPTGAVYQLTTFDDPTYTEPEIVARFLEQTTFGPTRSDIASFEGANNMDFALWVERQQQSSVTSHRQFYRARGNTRQEVATPQGAVTHPCQVGATYRRFALSSKDSPKSLEIVSSGTKRILKVDGFVRSVVDGPVHWKRGADVTFEDGIYDIAWHRQLNKIGGSFFLSHDGKNKNLDIAFGGKNGNPSIQFGAGQQPNVLLAIPIGGARAVDTQYYQGEDEVVQEIILTQTLSDVTCASLMEPGNPVNPVFALFDGVHWMHDPRFVSQLITQTMARCMIIIRNPDLLLIFRKRSIIQSSHRLLMAVGML